MVRVWCRAWRGRKCIARKCFCPRVRTSMYKRLHLLRYSIHARCPSPSSHSLPFHRFFTPVHTPIAGFSRTSVNISSFVVSRVLPTSWPLYVLHYSRRNCSIFPLLKRDRYSRSESRNSRKVWLHLEGDWYSTTALKRCNEDERKPGSYKNVWTVYDFAAASYLHTSRTGLERKFYYPTN